MLDKDPKTRISIEEILEHPWIKNNKSDGISHSHDVKLSKNFSSEVLQRMKQNKSCNILKKAAVLHFVEHIDPHQILDLQKLFN